MSAAYSQHDHDSLTLAPLSDAPAFPLTAPVSGNDIQVRPFLSSTTSSLDVYPCQLRVHITQPAPSHDSLQVDADQDHLSRPGSSTSSLDPYYFGVQSPSDSPPQQFQDPTLPSTTPETRIPNDSSSPLTPVRDPANIDRNGLVGVGELATPRWGKLVRRPSEDDDNALDVLQEEDSTDVVVPNIGPDGSDSPWTIEAVDGELDDQDQVGISFSLLLGHLLMSAPPV